MTVVTYQSMPPEVKRIANETLGVGVLAHMMSYDYTYEVVLKINNGVIVGFGVFHTKEVNISNELTSLTGVIDCVCVDRNYRNEGFGKSLTLAILRKMAARKVKRIEIIVKRPVDDEEMLGTEEFWTKIGFRRVKVLRRFYANQSDLYDCALCHDNPDSCDAVLLSIDGGWS